MKRRFMFACIWLDRGDTAGLVHPTTDGVAFPYVPRVLNRCGSRAGGGSTGNVKTFDELAKSLSLFSSERRHSQ